MPIGRWSHEELAWAAAENGLIDEGIHPASIGRILAEAECQPHRVRYWLRSQDPAFVPKATRVLWYYERARALYRQGIAVICLDEKPNIQALDRPHPDLPPQPGRVRRREFEYVRRGTVNLLLAHVVATGEMWGRVLARNDSANFVDALHGLLARFHWAERIDLILDNASSHTSRATRAAVATLGDRLRLHHTPFHASWLNQAEIALGIIYRRYLRGVPVRSRDEMTARINAGIDDHNHNYARPFNWSYTRHALQAKHAAKLPPN